MGKFNVDDVLAAMIFLLALFWIVMPFFNIATTNAAQEIGSNTQLNINSTNGSTLNLAHGDLVLNTENFTYWFNATQSNTLTKNINYTIILGSQTSYAQVTWIKTDAVILMNATYEYYYINENSPVYAILVVMLFLILVVAVRVQFLSKSK